MKSVTIPDSVTIIEGKAFEGCSGLASVTIGNGVKYIDPQMFSGRSDLTNVIIGNSVTNIGSSAFSDCISLTNVIIGAKVADINKKAFSGCSSLANVTIPNSVKSIGNEAFSGCSGLASATIGRGVTNISERVFEGCNNLTNITMHATKLTKCGALALPSQFPEYDENGDILHDDRLTVVFVAPDRANFILPVLKRDSIFFDGWWSEPVGGERIVDATDVERGKPYYAHWEKEGIASIELAIPSTVTVSDWDYEKIHSNYGNIDLDFIAAVYDIDGNAMEGWEKYCTIEIYGGNNYDELFARHLEDYGTWWCDENHYSLPAGSWLVKVIGDGINFRGEATAGFKVERAHYSSSWSDFTYWHLQISDGYNGYYSARDVHSGSTYIGYVDLGAYSAGSGGSVYLDVDDGAIPSYSSNCESSYGFYSSGYREFGGYRDGPGFQSNVWDDYNYYYDRRDRLITNAGLYRIAVSIDGSWSMWDDYYCEDVTFNGNDWVYVYLAPADFSSQTVSAVNAERVYTGEAVSILDTDFSIELSDPTSYFIENKMVVDAGTYSINIGVMSEGGSGSADWFCDPYEYERRSAGDYDYTTTWEERIVKDGNDCPIFNYTGVVEVVYTVLPRPVAAEQISFSMPQNLVYDGTAKVLSNISITNDFNGVELVEGTDYDVIYTDNVLPGRATAAIVCKGNYTGRFETAYQITPADFDIGHDEETGMYSGASGNIVPYEGVYDGEGHWALGEAAYGDDGQATVRYALSENGPYGEDYIVFTNVCDETVWVELSAPGYNSFTGAVNVAITPRSIENATVTARNIVEGPGRQPVFSLGIQDDGIGRTLVEGVDYCTNVENDDASGTTTVTVTGMGNYTGERVVETAYVKTCAIGGVNWRYWPVDGSVWLVSINQSSGEMPSVVAIPDEIDGLPVREVPDGFFAGCKSIETVVVGANVAKFGNRVFDGCTALKYVVFAGDAPGVNQNWIGGADGGESEFISVFTGAPSGVKVVAAKKDGGWGEAWPAGDEARQVMPAPTVGITPFSGKKSGRMAVTMTHDCEILEAVVRYTIDGTEPTAASTHYEKRFSINVTGLVSVKAAAFLGGVRISDVVETRYSPVLNDVLNIGDIIAKPGSAPLFFDLDSSNQWWSDETETSFDGTPSMKSGRIGNESSSWMSATFTGAGVLEFSWKASCEEDNLGEFFYDHAICELDGEEVAWIDGDSGEWERVEIAVETAGEHTVKWIYTKDAADDTIYPGADSVWVDGVKFSYPVYVSFAAGAGTGEPPQPQMGAIGYEIALPGQGGLSCAKHRFEGWSDGVRVYGAGASYAVGTADVTLTAVWSEKVLDAPVIEVAETYDEESTTVTIEASPGATIYYTTDGSEPNAETGVLYEGAFQVTGTTTIRAVAVADDWFDSAVAEAKTTRSWTSLEESLGAAGFALATGGDANWIGDAVERCVKTAGHAGGWLTASFEGPGVATYLLKEGDGEWTRHDEVFADGGNHVLRWEGESLMLKDLELLPVVAVSFSVGDDVKGDVPPTIYTAEGRHVEIPGGDGLSKPKHEFDGWSADGDVLRGGASYMAGAADVTLTAVWSEKRLSAPVIDAPATYESDSATVAIAAAAGASVYYTTDGTEPSADGATSRFYQGPFAVEGSATVKAVAIREDYFDSDVVSCAVTRLPWTLGECLNWPEQDFATDGDAAWERVKSASTDGFALRSGKIGNKQKSRLLTVVRGSGTISFMLKVSSEYDAETGEAYDGFVIAVDGNDVTEVIGGELDWRPMSFYIDGDGHHTIEWRYEKDKRDSGGEDCVWLDTVSWTPAETETGLIITADGESVVFESAADGKSRTAAVAEGTTAEDVKVFVGGVDVTAGFKVAVEGTTASVVLKEPFERTDDAAVSSKPPYRENDDGKTVTLNVEVVPGLYYTADSAATIEALKRPGAAEPAKAGDAVVAPKQEGAQGFYKVWVSDGPIEAE